MAALRDQRPAGVRPHEGKRERWCGVLCGTAEAKLLLKTCVDGMMRQAEQDLRMASHQHSAALSTFLSKSGLTP